MAEQFTAKLPNSMTYQELIDEGKTPEQAHEILRKRVFGDNHKLDAQGKVIEQGHGSPAHEARMKERGAISTPHQQALARENERKLLAGGNANADVIAAAVAAGMKAGAAQIREDEKL